LTAIVALTVAAGIVAAAILIDNLIFYFVISVLSAIATYEIVNNAYGVKSKRVVLLTVIYSFLMPFVYGGYIPYVTASFMTVLFVCTTFAFAISHNKVVSAQDMIISASIPIFLSFSFYSLAKLFEGGLFFLILVLNFAWICDSFAYFVGVAIGKHHIMPVISPKKTLEGCIGGVLGTVLFTFLICVVYNHSFGGEANTLFITLVSPIFAVAGMYGDLTASYIKRLNHIKDYGKVLPGHGGIMDRFDSVCTISPIVLTIFEMTGII